MTPPVDVLSLQQQLNSLGFGPLAEDGIYGRATAAAYEAYLATHPIDAPVPVPPAPPAPKPWWMSRRMIFGAVTVALGVAGLTDWDADQVTNVVVQLTETIAAAIALWGGMRATRPVDPGLVVPGWRVRDGKLRRVQLPDELSAGSEDPAKE